MEKKRNSGPSTTANDNHANQLNPNNDAYWSSRGLSRPFPTNETDGEPPSPEPDGRKTVPASNKNG